MTSLRSPLRRAAAFTGLMAVVAMLAACSTPSDSGNTGGATVAVVDGVVELSAADLAFDASVIQPPAGEPFTIRFTNNDTAPHNLAIDAQEGGDEIVTGDIISQGQTAEIQVPALDPGEYFFVCDLHPDMNGTIVVDG